MKNKTILIMSFILLMACTSYSQSQGRVIYSIGEVVLDAPLTIKECQYNKYRYIRPTKTACYNIRSKDFTNKRDDVLPDSVIDVIYTANDRPTIMQGFEMNISIESGVVKNISFDTLPPGQSEKVFDYLSSIFGKPSKTEQITKGNKLGAAYDGVLYEWTLHGVSVSYTTLSDRITSGQVVINTH